MFNVQMKKIFKREACLSGLIFGMIVGSGEYLGAFINDQNLLRAIISGLKSFLLIFFAGYCLAAILLKQGIRFYYNGSLGLILGIGFGLYFSFRFGPPFGAIYGISIFFIFFFKELIKTLKNSRG